MGHFYSYQLDSITLCLACVQMRDVHANKKARLQRNPVWGWKICFRGSNSTHISFVFRKKKGLNVYGIMICSGKGSALFILGDFSMLRIIFRLIGTSYSVPVSINIFYKLL